MQNIHQVMFNFVTDMEFIRTNSIIRFIWIITSLIILNCSIGGPEPESQRKGGLYERNIVESLVELIAEEFMSFKDSINENQNSDLDNSNSLSLKEANDFPSFPLSHTFVFKSHKIDITKVVIYKESYKEQFHPENTPPPPKA